MWLLRVREVNGEVPWKEWNLNILRIRGQQLGMLATRIAVLASRMYQKVHIGEKGCANE